MYPNTKRLYIWACTHKYKLYPTYIFVRVNTGYSHACVRKYIRVIKC